MVVTTSSQESLLGIISHSKVMPGKEGGREGRSQEGHIFWLDNNNVYTVDVHKWIQSSVIVSQ